MFNFYAPPLSFFILSLLFHISFIHLISLWSSLSISLLSHFATSIPHVLHCLFLLVTHSAPSFLFFDPIPPLSSFPHLNPAIIFPSFALSLLCHTPLYFLLYLDSLIFSLISCLSVSSSLSLRSTFIHLPFALNLSTSSLAGPFL
jgi:hypothetical protein